MEINKQAYDAYVKEVTPVHNKWLSIVKAFLVGGAICTRCSPTVQWCR